MTRSTLVPWPGIKPVPRTVEVQSLNHWTSKNILIQWSIFSDWFGCWESVVWFHIAHRMCSLNMVCVLKGCESMSSEVRNQIKRMIIRKKRPLGKEIISERKKPDITAQSSPINISSNNTQHLGGLQTEPTLPKTPLWPIPTSVTSPHGPLCHAPKINSRAWWSDHRDPPGTWA